MSERFRALLNQARLVPPNATAVEEALAGGNAVFVASANAQSLALGAPLTAAADLPSPQGPLPLRLLSLPKEEPAVVATAETVELALSESSQAASLPLASGQDLGQRSRATELVRGEGALEEILACFQMLGRWMKLPYRRTALKRSCAMPCAGARRPICNCWGNWPRVWACT